MRNRAHGWPLSRRAVLVAGAGFVAAAGVAGPAAAHAGFVAAAGAAGPAAAQDASAEAFVQTVGNQVLGVLKDDSLGDQQKTAKLKQILNQATNLELVARIILGRYWPKATAQQRQEYLRLFDALVMQTMAERIPLLHRPDLRHHRLAQGRRPGHGGHDGDLAALGRAAVPR